MVVTVASASKLPMALIGRAEDFRAAVPRAPVGLVGTVVRPLLSPGSSCAVARSVMADASVADAWTGLGAERPARATSRILSGPLWSSPTMEGTLGLFSPSFRVRAMPPMKPLFAFGLAASAVPSAVVTTFGEATDTPDTRLGREKRLFNQAFTLLVGDATDCGSEMGLVPSSGDVETR